MRPSHMLVVVLACLPLLTSCASLAGGEDGAPLSNTDVPEGSVLVARHLESIVRLGSVPAAEQGGMTEEARIDFVAVPTPSNRLRYAMVLATPGHAGFDPYLAQDLLQALLSEPGALSDAERSLAKVSSRQLEKILSVLDQLHERDAAVVLVQERLAATDQRNQSLTAEVVRLSQELDLANRKLEAVAELEKALSIRRVAPEGNP